MIVFHQIRPQKYRSAAFQYINASTILICAVVQRLIIICFSVFVGRPDRPYNLLTERFIWKRLDRICYSLGPSLCAIMQT